MELAITKGADFIRFSRNAKAIVLPDGGTVLGPVTCLPHRHGDYVLRAVTVTGPLPGENQLAGLEPPVVAGEAVVLRRTVTTITANGAEQ